MATQQQLLAQQKAALEQEKIGEDVKAKRAQAARDALVPVSDQASWTAWREQRTPQEQQIIPVGFTPEARQRFLSTADQFLQNLRHATPSGSALLAEQGAAQRHAVPSGGAELAAQTSLRGQDITLRGQNLEEARARETLAQGKAPTGEMLTAAGYADRMAAAEKIMQPLEAVGGKPGVIESAVGVLPGVGKVAANVARPEERQRYRQAQEDWVRAKLRKESGAVIADEEMDREIRVYFPQIGDSPEVVAQKRQARVVAAQSMARSAGPRLQQSVGGGNLDVIDFNALP